MKKQLFRTGAGWRWTGRQDAGAKSPASTDAAPPHYELQVTHRGAPPKPWKWEIYRDDEILPVEQSTEFYAHRLECERLGRDALMRLRQSRT